MRNRVVDLLLAGPIQVAPNIRPPAAPGIYAWWCRKEALSAASPAIPQETRDPMDPTWSLLYVGIAPSRPGPRTLADRIGKDHSKGNIGGSTFRQSLAALLLTKLELKAKPGSDRSRLVSETALQTWMDTYLGVTVAVQPSPWEVEAEVIAVLGPPLNIQSAAHPFAQEVSAKRADLRRACGVGPT